ncbi:MAG: KAP family NTPase [Oscillospiraceae bacterium]|nr:KAP family NTPase [Oscillospiraceae bacterium]
MSKKADSLVDIMNLFKPHALTAEQQDFYQKTSAVRDGDPFEFHDSLYKRIKNSGTHERLLVVGHLGCGKSTELQMLTKKLSNDKFAVIYIEARDRLDLFNFNYIDICMLIVEDMTKYAKDNNLNVDKHILSAFQNALSTKTIEEYWGTGTEISADASASVSATIPFFLNLIAKITSSLKTASGIKEELRHEIAPRIGDVVAALNAFVEHISELASRQVVIIIDGLEKCRQERVRNLFVEDITAILEIKAHLVTTCPIALYRSTDAGVLAGYFTSPVVIPMIKTHYQDGTPYEDGVDVIRELILKRADLSFFEDGVLDTIIMSAGGSLRDTCYILSNSAFAADMRDRQTIDMESVEVELRKFTSDIFFRVESRLFPKNVKMIYEGEHQPKQDPELSELLYCGAVFEYNGDRWVDLHPLLRKYIDNHPGVLSE